MNRLTRCGAALLAVLLTIGCVAGCNVEETASNPSSSLENTASSLLSDLEEVSTQHTTTTTTQQETTTTTITTTTTTTTVTTTTTTTAVTTKKSTTKKSTTTSRITTTERVEEQSAMVWITETGKKYHSHSKCGRTKNATKVSLDYAQSLGLEPCQKCYG